MEAAAGEFLHQNSNVDDISSMEVDESPQIKDEVGDLNTGEVNTQTERPVLQKIEDLGINNGVRCNEVKESQVRVTENKVEVDTQNESPEIPKIQDLDISEGTSCSEAAVFSSRVAEKNVNEKATSSVSTMFQESVNSHKVNDDVIDSENTVFQESADDQNSKGCDLQKELLDKLGLSEYYPDKISMKTVMQKSSMKLDALADIPWYFLTKLLMIDFRGRDHILSQRIREQLNADAEASSASGCEEECDDFFSEISLGYLSKDFPNLPHPIDVLVLVFRCCSNFLRQILCEKMFMCKLSIPFVLPPFMDSESLLSLWSLRNLSLEVTQPNGELCERSIVSHPTPIISCMRLGEISRSKSKFLNELVNGQSHPTFYHRDCEGGMNLRSVSEGLIELSWRMSPRNVGNTDKEKLLYQYSCLTLYNLRGDGKSHEKAKEFLCRVSDIVLIMVDISELEAPDVIESLKLIESDEVELILMLSKDKNSRYSLAELKAKVAACLDKVKFSSFPKDNLLFDFNAAGEKNIKVLKEEIEMKISKCLKRRSSKHAIEDCVGYANDLNIIVDESTPECIKGKEMALRVVEIACEGGKENLRKSRLPLQCGPWQEWSKMNKEEHRREKKGMDHLNKYMNKIHLDKKAQRKEQLRLLKRPNLLFDKFLENLLNSKGKLRYYYLRWLKLHLDDLSREILPGLQKNLCSKWNEIHQCEDKRKLLVLQKALVHLEDTLSESSFGLEHFIREMSQAYECVAALEKEAPKKLKEKIMGLPKLMAEFMRQGYALELMDGDAASVPLQWVKAVLGHLTELIGDKKIFVLSVLGIQSSGKSTLLNTMFGLQFAVAAGRCTRGVYAQLVPIPKEFSGSDYDYVLVVDTEGLRAAELGGDKLQHDNEIATLVIGLGDVTLVNFKGENVAEMEDVLQIVVHALLKMKLVNKNLALQPSCFFIHQNVPAPDAAQKLRSGQQKFIESLDKVTKAAGKQEDMPQYTKFSQIMGFDINTNISYFSDLWRGDPPVGHANPGYSENVWKVKQTLLTEIMQKRTTYLNLQKFCTKITDLWHGILDENFVFSFKNSLELEAYSLLESKLSDILWALKKTALKWQNDKENEIMSSESVPEKLKNTLSKDCCSHLGTFYASGKEKLQSIFDENEDRSILEQWRARTFRKLECCYEDIIERINEGLKAKLKIKQIQNDQKSKVEMYKGGIMGEAKKLAEDLRSSEDHEDLSDAELESHFNEKWKEWIESLPENHKHCISIEEIVCKVLYEKFRHDSVLVNKAIEKQQTRDSVIRGNFLHAVDTYISMKKWFLGLIPLGSVRVNCNEFLDTIYGKMESLVESDKNQGLKREYGGLLIEMAKEMIRDMERLGLTVDKEDEFEICIASCTCQYMTYKFFRPGKFEGFDNDRYQLQEYGIHPFLEEKLFQEYSSKLMPVLHKSQQKGIGKLLFFFDEYLIRNKSISKYEAGRAIANLVSSLEEDVEAYISKPQIQDFREEYAEEVINSVVNQTKEGILPGIVGKELKISIAVYISYLSLPKFIEKHRKYTDNLSPRRVLERDYYATYLQMYKNSYKQITGEMALASVLSQHLSSAMAVAVDKEMAADLTEDIRNNVPEVKMKSALLKAILYKLLEEDDFEEFMLYLEDTNACFEKWISHYVNSYLFTKGMNGTYRYTDIAFSNIAVMIYKVCLEVSKPMTSIPEDVFGKDALFHWLQEFQERVSEKVVVSLQDLKGLTDGYDIVSLDSFSEHFEKSLHEAEEKLKESFKDHDETHLKLAQETNVYELVSVECKGCTEKCPFCYAPCTLNTVGHIEGGEGIKHMAKEHYPQACGRYCYADSNKLVSENCSVNVAGDSSFRCTHTKWNWHPDKKYQEIYPDWKIDGDPSVEASPYWKWFLVKYDAQLAERFKAERPDIPSSWKDISKDMAKESVN